MGKTSFQSLDQLVKNISENINLLNNGQLNSSQIEALTENTRDLYERLIVIRHKTYEKFGESEAESTPEVEKEVIETVTELAEESIFDFAPEEVKEEVKEEVDDMMSFDFSEPIAETQPVIEEEPIVETAVEEETIPEVETPIEKEMSSLNDSISSASTSLNDGFKSSHSLADRLNQSKIVDLKSSIDINKKFSFITGLFAGSNEDYNEAISTLNSCTDGDQARNLLGGLAEKHRWDVEEKTVLTFVELIERRYL